MLRKLLDLRKFIENTLPESNVIISNFITRTDDNGKASLTVIKNKLTFTWFVNGYHRQWKYNLK